MKGLFLSLMTFIVSCATTSGYVPKFSQGDCVVYDKKQLQPGQEDTGVVGMVLDVGKESYAIYYVHPFFGHQVQVFKSDKMDQKFLKSSCPEGYSDVLKKFKGLE